MVDSALDFLNSYDEKSNDSIPTVEIGTINDDSIPEADTPELNALDFLNSVDGESLQEVEEPQPIVVDDASQILIPRADDPAFYGTDVEPKYEYDPDKRYNEAKAEADETDAIIASLSEEEREKLFADMQADIAKGSTDEGGTRTPLDWLMSKIPPESLLAFGNAINVTGAMTMDNLEGGLNYVKENYPSVFNTLDSAITGARYGNKEEPDDLAEFIRDGLGAAGEFIETLPALNQVRGAVDKVLYSGPRNVAAGLTSQVRRTNKAMLKARNIKSAGGADLAAREVAEQARLKAANIANANRDIADNLIRSFEENTGKVISRKSGSNLVIDPELSREAGVETAREITERDGALFDLRIGDDFITSPLLQPDKFNGIVAAASKLKQKFPDTFNNNNTVIDNLFELTVNRDLELDGQELVDTLDEFGLSFEDYVLTVVGSGSEAGKILNKLSQIKRTKTGTAFDPIVDEKKVGSARRFIMRVENIRRGGLVSQIATASRNLTSAGVRLPLESLGNVMDNAIYAVQNDGISGVSKLVSGSNWKDSFKGYKYIFSRPDVAKDYTDLILNQPELSKQFSAMFNNLNEIQKITGRGEGGITDKILSGLEDGVDFLNTPNRWQEHLVRRGVFFSELERLSKRELGIDLVDVLQDGKIKSLLNDSSSAVKRSPNQRSFLSLVDDATNRALDVTYAKQPEIPVFKATSQFITQNGLTVVVPFPRFMFNSMELMGQYAAGASIPLTRKMSSLVTRGRVGGGPLTDKDRQRITRNMLGIAAVGAAYMYRTSEDAPSEYEKVPVGDEAQLDTTATYPMAQYLYVGEMVKRMKEGTFSARFDAKEFVELFTGSNFRTGVGNSVLEEIAEIASGTDLTSGEKVGKAIGRPLGNYLSTWLVPFGQIIDAERAAGVRGTEFKETGVDPSFDFVDTFKNETLKPLRNRGILLSADAEAQLPNKEYAGFYDGRDRMYPGAKILGLSMTSAPSEDVEYLGDLGLTWRDLGSKSKVPSIKNFEIRMLNEKVLPTVVEMAREHEIKLKNKYAEANTATREEFTEREYVSNNLRPLVQAQIKKFKGNITKVSVSQGDAYTRAMTTYRRVPAELRKLATTKFIEREGRVPDPTEANDLNMLNIIGKAIGKAYRK